MNQQSTEEPLVWTTKGNLPVSSLEYAVSWVDAADYIRFIEVYTLNGETVRESAHTYIKPHAAAKLAQGVIS